MMSACPEILLGCLSSSVGLGVMPPALALASVPLVHEVVDGRRPSSTALTPAAVALLEAPQSGVVHFTISYAESTRAGIECHQLLPPSLRNSWTGLARVNLWTWGICWRTMFPSFNNWTHLVVIMPSHRCLECWGLALERWRAYPRGFTTSWHISLFEQLTRLCGICWPMPAWWLGGSEAWWAGWITIGASASRRHWIPRWGGTRSTLEFRQQHWLAALPVQPCFAAYAGNQTTLQGSVPSSLPLGPPMLPVHQFGHLA